jgi:hypothetical protein
MWYETSLRLAPHRPLAAGETGAPQAPVTRGVSATSSMLAAALPVLAALSGLKCLSV